MARGATAAIQNPGKLRASISSQQALERNKPQEEQAPAGAISPSLKGGVFNQLRIIRDIRKDEEKTQQERSDLPEPSEHQKIAGRAGGAIASRFASGVGATIGGPAGLLAAQAIKRKAEQAAQDALGQQGGTLSGKLDQFGLNNPIVAKRVNSFILNILGPPTKFILPWLVFNLEMVLGYYAFKQKSRFIPALKWENIDGGRSLRMFPNLVLHAALLFIDFLVLGILVLVIATMMLPYLALIVLAYDIYNLLDSGSTVILGPLIRSFISF